MQTIAVKSLRNPKKNKFTSDFMTSEFTGFTEPVNSLASLKQ